MNDTTDKNIPSDEHFAESAELFRLLDDGSRAKIFWLLCHSEKCIAELASISNMTSPAISHHLRLLRKSGLIQSIRKGKEVYYKASKTPSATVLHEALEKIMCITCPEKKKK